MDQQKSKTNFAVPDKNIDNVTAIYNINVKRNHRIADGGEKHAVSEQKRTP